MLTHRGKTNQPLFPSIHWTAGESDTRWLRYEFISTLGIKVSRKLNNKWLRVIFVFCIFMYLFYKLWRVYFVPLSEIDRGPLLVMWRPSWVSFLKSELVTVLRRKVEIFPPPTSGGLKDLVRATRSQSWKCETIHQAIGSNYILLFLSKICVSFRRVGLEIPQRCNTPLRSITGFLFRLNLDADHSIEVLLKENGCKRCQITSKPF